MHKGQEGREGAKRYGKVGMHRKRWGGDRSGKRGEVGIVKAACLKKEKGREETDKDLEKKEL